MKIVARFITRLQGEDDGLFIGSLFKNGKDLFKPNTVYEIRDVLGTLTIVEVGQGVGAGSDNCVSTKITHQTPFHWAQHIGEILDYHGKVMFLTMKEYLAELSFWSKEH